MTNNVTMVITVVITVVVTVVVAVVVAVAVAVTEMAVVTPQPLFLPHLFESLR